MSIRSLVGAVAAAGVLLTGCAAADDRHTVPVASSPAATESTAPAGLLAWVDTLPVGPPPTVGYGIGHTYHSPDGRMVRVPPDRVLGPTVPPSEGTPEVWTRRSGRIDVVDRVTERVIARLAAPGPWIRGRLWSAAWEDRARLLVSVVRRGGADAAILRVDVRSGRWQLAVDWTATEDTHAVTFETRR